MAARADQFPIDLDVALADQQIGTFSKDSVPELIVSYSGLVTARIRLVRDRYILGRSELSDIVIDNRFVSKHHALLVKGEHGLLLADMKSRNGTFVNSKRVESRVLRNNDVIALGDYRIKVICAPGVAVSTAPQGALAETARTRDVPRNWLSCPSTTSGAKPEAVLEFAFDRQVREEPVLDPLHERPCRLRVQGSVIRHPADLAVLC